MYCLHVVGARPNFMKAAPLIRVLSSRDGVEQKVVHTGQHYEPTMSDVFFEELEIPKPDFSLGVGSGTHGQQTSRVMLRFEEIVLKEKPDLIIVYGDVNSTIAAALIASKLHVRVAHVEAGLRSFDRTMPEEINRLLTDQIADLLFTPSQDADENLMREGIPSDRIYFVGNIMIDTLIHQRPRIAEVEGELHPGRYALVTLHRPSNVDDLPMLGRIMTVLSHISIELPVIFPCHPRTRRKLTEIEFRPPESLWLCEPKSYLHFLRLQEEATVVITDSGGIQEETTFLGVPCLTLRDSTERPVTVTLGTNKLIGRCPDRIHQEVRAVLAGKHKSGRVPPLWDGHTADRIADCLSRARNLPCSLRQPSTMGDFATIRSAHYA